MHKFDRIYSIDGPQAMPGRIVAHQDDNGDTFTVLAYFSIAKHNEYTDFLNLLGKRWQVHREANPHVLQV